MKSVLLEPDLAVAVKEIGDLGSEEDQDEWHMPMFAFHDLDYIPSGYGGILAPYIETGPGSKYGRSSFPLVQCSTLEPLLSKLHANKPFL